MDGGPSRASSTKTGRLMANSFTANWSAWTKVMPRIPPATTIETTTTATTATPAA